MSHPYKEYSEIILSNLLYMPHTYLKSMMQYRFLPWNWLPYKPSTITLLTDFHILVKIHTMHCTSNSI